MTAEVFVDTNILVYARDAAEPDRQPRASAWLDRLWRERHGRLSIQVLQEYYATVTRKLRPRLDPDTARADVRRFMGWKPITLDRDILAAAWLLEDRYSVSWWDALIVAAARRAGCAWLLTEDFQDGAVLDGVQIISPFTHDPAAALG